MAAPSLSELTNFRVDPALGGASPRVLIDNKGVVENLNRAAEFQAENAWRKYNAFQKNLSDIYASLDEDAKLETMPQDKKILDDKAKNIFDLIASDPRTLSPGSTKNRDLQKQLFDLKKDAFRSKQDYLFDQAHREFISRQPELNTPENNSKFDQFGNTPLGERKAFSLDMPVQFDYDAYRKGILGLATKPFAETQGVGQDLKSPGNDFFLETKGNKTSVDAFTKLWDAGLQTQVDKYGHSIRGAIQQRFNLLPKDIQEQYKQEAEKAKQDPVVLFFHDMGQSELNAQGTPQSGFITNITESKPTANVFAEEQKKADDKLKQMGVQFTYDKILESMRIGAQKDLALFKEQIKDLKQGQQVDILNGLVDRQVQNAKSHPAYSAGLQSPDIDNNAQQYVMQVSPETLKLFGIKEQGSGVNSAKTVTVYPENITVNDDGSKVTAVFRYQQGDRIPSGKKVGDIDTEKTKTFDIDEYKLRMGKDILGVAGLNKQYSKPAQQHTETKTSSYKIKGKSYTHKQLNDLGYTDEQIEAAKKSGAIQQ